MAAVTTILNPINGGKSTILFYLSEIGLALIQQKNDADNHRSMDDVDTPYKFVERPSDNTRGDIGDEKPVDDEKVNYIKNPSSLGVIRHQDLISVYGIDYKGDLSLVSPVYEPIRPANTAVSGSLAATGDDDSTGWVYYLTNDPPRIAEYGLQYDNKEDLEGLGLPHPNTYLDALYDPDTGDRYVMFQEREGKINCARIYANGNAGNAIPGTANAKIKTPLAAFRVPTADRKFEIYLYYCNNDNTLQRVTRNASGAWSDPQTPKKAPPRLSDFTQITGVLHVSRRVISLYYAVKGGNGKFITFRDQL